MANLSNLTNNNEIIFDDILNKINTNVTQAVKETLTPFISKMKEEKNIYQEIVSVMKKMPEFKKIINENELLLKERDYLLKFGVVKKTDPIAEPIAEHLAEPIAETIAEPIIEFIEATISVEPIESIELVVENIEKSDELLLIVSEEEKMPIVIKEEKIEIVSPQQKQNKQTITLEITNHHETISNIEEDNLDDKIKQIYLDANLLDSQPQSGTASEAQSEAQSETASEAASEAASEEDLEEDLAELAEQINDAASEAEEAQSEAEEAASEAEEAQSEAEEAQSEAEEAQSEAEEAQSEAEEAQSEADDDEVEEESANEVASANEVEEDSDSEPEEVFIVDIKDKGQFYTTNEQNGDIYEILVDSNDDIGEKIGKFKDGKANFF